MISQGKYNNKTYEHKVFEREEVEDQKWLLFQDILYCGFWPSGFTDKLRLKNSFSFSKLDLDIHTCISFNIRVLCGSRSYCLTDTLQEQA